LAKFIGMEEQEITQQIDIATRQLAYAKDPIQKESIGKKLQKLKLEREIANIRKRIDALSK
jgi:hypothetical protein